MGRTITGHAKGTIMPQLYITEGKKEMLTGICLYFLRGKNDTELNIRNIGEVFHLFDLIS